MDSDEKSIVETIAEEIAEEITESAKAVVADVKAIAAEIAEVVADCGNGNQGNEKEKPAGSSAPGKTGGNARA